MAVVAVSGGLLSYGVLAPWVVGVGDGRLLLASATTMTAGAVVAATVPAVPVVAAAAFAISVGLNLGWLALQHRSLTLRPGQVGTTKAVVTVIEFSGFWIPVALGLLADRAGAVGAFGALGAAMAP